jgi:hypothetical protein
MARTSRNGAPSAGSEDAGALDALDLDGMFADDGDILFEGLDIDLDGMGDLTEASSSSQKPHKSSSKKARSHTHTNTATSNTNRSTPSPAASATRGGRGPKTKRPPPPPPPPPEEEDYPLPMPKRQQRSKRKPKSPLFWDNEDGDYVTEEQAQAQAQAAAVGPTKKKRRSAKAMAAAAAALAASTTTTTTNKMKRKKEKDLAGSPPTKKRKDKAGSISIMPPPMSRGGSLTNTNTTSNSNSNSNVSVAAAGRFGKRGGLPLALNKKSKRKSSDSSNSVTNNTTTNTTKTKTKLPSSSSNYSIPGALSSLSTHTNPSLPLSSPPLLLPLGTGTGTGTGYPHHDPTAPPPPPKPEPTDCGLRPSADFFYPFLDGLPLETTLKHRKLYPILDKISTALGSAVQNPHALITNVTTENEHETETEPLVHQENGNVNVNVNPDQDQDDPEHNPEHNPDNPDHDDPLIPEPEPEKEMPVSEQSPIFKLLAETYVLSDKDKAAFTPDKIWALTMAVPQVREAIRDMDKTKLVQDFYSMCGLLHRQAGFLQQNLSNMERWCHANFTPADYHATYHDTTGGGNDLGDDDDPDRSISTETLNKRPASSVLSGLWTPYLKIKVKCVTFKEPKGGNPLVAILPSSIVQIPTAAVNNANYPNINAKMSLASKSGAGGAPGMAFMANRKTKNLMDASGNPKFGHPNAAMLPTTLKEQALAHLLANPPPPPPPPLEKCSYAEATPSQRRQRIMDHVAARQRVLEGHHYDTMETRDKQGIQRASDTKKLVHEDNILSLHTSLMWQALEMAGYLLPCSDQSYFPYSQRNVQEVLQTAWSPELDLTQPLLRQVPKLIRSTGSRHDPQPATTMDEEDADDSSPEQSSNSLYNRLQSLLVEESDDDDDDDNRETDVHDSDSDSDEDALSFLDDSDDENDIHIHDNPQDGNGSRTQLADLSAFTLEERTFLQLRMAGLIQQPLFPLVELSCDDHPQEDHDGDDHEHDQDPDHLPEHRDELVNTIGRMSVDLAQLATTNNTRVAHLQSAGRHLYQELLSTKRQDEENATLITKCQALLKKSKETKAKQNKTRSKKNNDLNLPW